MYKKYNTLVEFCTNGIEIETIAIIFHGAVNSPHCLQNSCKLCGLLMPQASAQ